MRFKYSQVNFQDHKMTWFLLTQTGARFCCCNAIMEKFAQDYSIFNLPYLFENKEFIIWLWMIQKLQLNL